MRKIYFILSILALLSLSCTLKAQRKIALLIAGDHTKSPQVSPNQVIYPWNDTFGSSLDWEEFWNDSYLWYETFKYSFNEGGYGYNSVYFLFSDGSFYPASTYNVRYNKTGTEIFGKASLEKVQYVLNHLANDLTVDDFLFIWTMGHGGFCNNENDHIMYLSDNNGVTEYITATEFSNLVNSINAGKKVIFMQQPSSAGFDKFNSADNTIFYSSCLANQASYRANDTPFLENEIWITNMIPKKYYHGEFNFHTYSAINFQMLI